MEDSGGKPSSDGECNKVITFKIIQGAEAKCTITPANVGVAPQAIALQVTADQRFYTGGMHVVINRNPEVGFTIKDTAVDNYMSYFKGEYKATLKSAGKYYIAVVADRKLEGHGRDEFIPNVLPCSDPSDSVPRYCGAGICNYTVTNPGGSGGGEVAPSF